MTTLQAATQTGILPVSQDITEALYARFIAYLDAKPKTIQTYARALRQLFKYFSSHGIARPSREDIIAFRDWLKEAHKPTTVQNYIAAARLFFQWLKHEGIYPNVAEHVKGATIDKEHKKDYLTSAQIKSVMDAVDQSTECGLRDYALLAVMVTGGLRTVEVSRADVNDLRTVGDSPALLIQGKGKDEKTEYIKLQPKVERAVREYIKARGSVDQMGPLFASTSNNSAGRRLSTRSISGIVKSRLKDAGYDSDRLTAHSLRHTAVTLSLLAGKEMEEVRQFARHSNIATTQIYNHALDRAKNSCGEAIAAAIF